MEDNLTREEARTRAALLRDVTYEIRLDLTRQDGFRSESAVRFASAPGASTFLDCLATEVVSAELNGRRLPNEAVGSHRIALDGLEDRNELRVVAEMPYRAGEHGMTRFTDPVDEAVYVFSDCEPFGAHRVFACFDQPDIKGSVRFEVIAPEGWTVISNMAPETREDGRWVFRTSPVIPPYLAAVVAGPFHEVRDRHGEIDLGLYCRATLAEHLDPEEIFEITKQGFSFYQEVFGKPYAFGKYDQVFVPEYAAGAMENPGCVTFNEMHIFRSRVTDARREGRAETILHEMAHMWFGDLVTMRWWDDLWLNETFATYMAALAMERATRFTDPWTTFAHIEKSWASRQDQLPTTHPIVAHVPDVESVFLNFDGITYAKGAAVMRQLVEWVGIERFLEGMRLYFERFAFGNATLADFLDVHQEASGRNLHAWAEVWLRAEGINLIRPEVRDGTMALAQEREPLRPHRLVVGGYVDGGDKLVRRVRAELEVTGSRTEVPELSGEDWELLLANDDDLTYAKSGFDEASLAVVRARLSQIGDSLSRAVAWRGIWDLTRDGAWPAREYLASVLDHVHVETLPSVVQRILGQASVAVSVYGDPRNRAAAGGGLASSAFEALRGAEQGSDLQLIWARAFLGAARSEEHLGIARGLLDGREEIPGLAMDTDLRWHVVRCLAAAGAADEDLIAAEERRDPSDEGTREAAAARTARPDPEAKAWAWDLLTGSEAPRLALARAVMRGFQQPEQEDLLASYAGRYFEVLTDVWERYDLPLASSFGRGMYPSAVVRDEVLERTDAMLEGDLPGPMRRLLLEGRDELRRTLEARRVDAAAG